MTPLVLSLTDRGVWRCTVAAVLFGLSTPAASRLADRTNPFTLAGLLYLGAMLAVAPFAARNRPSRYAIRRARSRLAVAVVVGGAFGPVFLAIGLRPTASATVSLLLNLELVFTTVLAVTVFREHLGRRILLGSALVAGAGILLAWADTAAFRWGAVAVIGACLCWAIDNSVTANLDDLAPVHITASKGAIAGSVNLTIGLVAAGRPPLTTVLAALAIGAVGYGASITLWISGASELGAARAQLVFATAPFIGAAVAWTVLGEPVRARQIVSLTVALVGVSLVLRSGHLHVHRHNLVEHDHEHDHADDHHEHLHNDAAALAGRHAHRHRHEPVTHDHGHLPDIHHRHDHP